MKCHSTLMVDFLISLDTNCTWNMQTFLWNLDVPWSINLD